MSPYEALREYIQKLTAERDALKVERDELKVRLAKYETSTPAVH